MATRTIQEIDTLASDLVNTGLPLIATIYKGGEDTDGYTMLKYTSTDCGAVEINILTEDLIDLARLAEHVGD